MELDDDINLEKAKQIKGAMAPWAKEAIDGRDSLRVDTDKHDEIRLRSQTECQKQSKKDDKFSNRCKIPSGGGLILLSPRMRHNIEQIST